MTFKKVHSEIIDNLQKCPTCGEYNGNIKQEGVEGGWPIMCLCKSNFKSPKCGHATHFPGMHYFTDSAGLQYKTRAEGQGLCERCIDENKKITLEKWLQEAFYILGTAKIYFDDSRSSCTYLMHWGLELILKAFLYDKTGKFDEHHDIKKLYKQCKKVDQLFPDIQDLVYTINPAGKNRGGIRYPSNKIKVKNISPFILGIYIDPLHKYVLANINLSKEILLHENHSKLN